MSALIQHQRMCRRVLTARVSATGVCDTVEGYEPKKAPKRGDMHCAIVNGATRVVPNASTLANVAQWFPFTLHFYFALPIHDTPSEDRVDPAMTDARDTVMQALLTQVDAYGNAGVELDPLGAYGDPMRSEPGYLPQDDTHFRTESLVVGFIAFNAYETSRQ